MGINMDSYQPRENTGSAAQSTTPKSIEAGAIHRFSLKRGLISCLTRVDEPANVMAIFEALFCSKKSVAKNE
jgi:hypothetical protein